MLEGPFAGMVLSTSTHKERVGPYLLGCYEQAIQSWIERAIAAARSLVIDVGIKVGYYAVGMARRLGGTRVVAFDTDRWARDATAEMAAADRVTVDVRGFCDPAAMRSLLGPSAFVISDCEGYEDCLLTPETAGDYRHATLPIETHEALLPGVEARIISAFFVTQTIEEAEDAGRASPPPMDLSYLDPAELEICADEFRSANRWLLLTPKTR